MLLLDRLEGFAETTPSPYRVTASHLSGASSVISTFHAIFYLIAATAHHTTKCVYSSTCINSSYSSLHNTNGDRPCVIDGTQSEASQHPSPCDIHRCCCFVQPQYLLNQSPLPFFKAPEQLPATVSQPLRAIRAMHQHRPSALLPPHPPLTAR